jgi:hypothetical protein
MNGKFHPSLLFAASLMLATENVFSAESIVTPAMAGQWEGNARIVVNWCRQTNLYVAVDINTNGGVTGKVGDATLVDAHFRLYRGWLGRKLNLWSDYIIEGKLNAPIVATEAITRNFVSIPLDFKDGVYSGGIITSGSLCLFAGPEERKAKMALTAMALKLTHPKPNP